MGFTKSKVDPNLYMKIMDDEPIIILMYVDDLFSNWKWETDHRLEEEASWIIRDERSWIDALFPRARIVLEPRKNISK